MTLAPRLRNDGTAAPYGQPARIASPLDIMLSGPIGGASFNNEFGRPNLGGYFRVYQQNVGNRRFGFHKPIMIAGGIGNIRDMHTAKDGLPPGALLIQLGGPGMRIGMGGGAASSMADRRQSGRSRLRFGAAWQSRNAAPRAGGDRPLLGAGHGNPILSIHDVGRGRPVQRLSGTGRRRRPRRTL